MWWEWNAWLTRSRLVHRRHTVSAAAISATASASPETTTDDSGAHLLVGTLRDVTAQHLTAERDAVVARLAGLLAGVDDSAHVVNVGLAEFRDCWQAERVSLLRYGPSGGPGTDGSADVPGLTATTGPAEPSGPALPPRAAAEHARNGTLFTTAGHGPPPGSPTT